MRGVDYFLPLADHRVEDDWLIRARLLVSVTFAMAIMLSLALALQPWLQLPTLSPWNGLCALMFLAAPVVLRATGSLAAAAHLAILGAVWLITWYCIRLGGVSSTAFIWFAVIPVFGFLVVGRRFGLIWCALSLGLAAAIGILHVNGYTHDPTQSSGTRAVQSGLNFLCLFLCLLSVGMMFESFKNQTIERLHQTLADLESSRQLAEAATLAKGQFLANMSHEIRTPMNGVLGMTELLLRSDLSAEQRDLADGSLRSARGLLTILNDVLDFSKIEAGALRLEPKPTSIRALVSDVRLLFTAEAERKQLGLIAEVGTEVPDWLEIDGARLTQVLTNLIANALRFTEEGTIRIGISWREHVGDAGELLVEVVDSGIGIPQEAQDRLFQPFTQADDSDSRRFGGTGLGLAISREIIERMGGTIDFESVPGRGSRFYFLLAVRSTAPVETASAPRLLRRGSGPERPRVLVAEDQPVNQDLARAFLEAAGMAVQVVPDGREAVEAVAADAPSLVLMDCQMPLLDGYAATQELRRSGFRGPIVGVTASAMAGDRERCLDAGMDDYLAKPFSGEALTDLVWRWIEPMRRDPATRAPATPEGTLDPQEALDPSALDQIRELDPEGRTGLVARVLGSYVSSLEEEIQEIRTAVAGDCSDEVARLAHKLKSASAAVGAHEVARNATALEVAASEDDGPEIGRLSAELGLAAERVLPALRELLDPTEGGGS